MDFNKEFADLSGLYEAIYCLWVKNGRIKKAIVKSRPGWKGRLFHYREIDGQAISHSFLDYHKYKDGDTMEVIVNKGVFEEELSRGSFPKPEIIKLLISLDISEEIIIKTFEKSDIFLPKREYVYKGEKQKNFEEKESFLFKGDLRFFCINGKWELKKSRYSSGTDVSSDDEYGIRAFGVGYRAINEDVSLKPGDALEAEQALSKFFSTVAKEQGLYDEDLNKAEKKYDEDYNNHPVIGWFKSLSEFEKEIIWEKAISGSKRSPLRIVFSKITSYEEKFRNLLLVISEMR